MSFKEYLADNGMNIMSENAKELTKIIRTKAQERSWPMDAIKALRVYYDEEADEYNVTYPPGLKKIIENLEYGTQNQPPSPIIRPFLNRIGTYLGPLTGQFEQFVVDQVDLGD